MKARVPGGYGGQNFNDMIKQAQKMQEKMGLLQEELAVREYTASSGGGAVEVTVTGKKLVTALKIREDVVDPEDVEMLEDTVMAAVNEALRKADEDSAKEMEMLTGSAQMPMGI